MQALWMIASSFLFASMGVCVKFASQYFSSAELVFYRGVLGMIFMAAYAHARGTSLATRFPAMHAWRSVVGVVSLSAWFYAIAVALSRVRVIMPCRVVRGQRAA